MVFHSSFIIKMMRSAATRTLLLIIAVIVAPLGLVHGAPAFISSTRSTKVTGVKMSSDANKNNPCQQQWPPAGHPSTLPGDPSLKMSSDANKNNPCQQQWPPAGHPSTLPGDPSLILTTNVDLGDKKMDIMKACSKAISAATGKPESYIAVAVTDNASMIFGGSSEPLAYPMGKSRPALLSSLRLLESPATESTSTSS